MLGLLGGLSRSLYCSSDHIRVDFVEYVVQTQIAVIARNVFEVFLKAYLQLGSFGLHTIGCMFCMLVDKFPIYCEVECHCPLEV